MVTNRFWCVYGGVSTLKVKWIFYQVITSVVEKGGYKNYSHSFFQQKTAEKTNTHADLTVTGN